MARKEISRILLILKWWNVTISVVLAKLDIHEYNRDQIETLRLQCQGPAGMCCIFFPTDENEVVREMNCLVSSEFFLEQCCLQKHLSSSLCLSSCQSQLERQGNGWAGNNISGLSQPSVLSHLATRGIVTGSICLSCLCGERGNVYKTEYASKSLLFLGPIPNRSSGRKWHFWLHFRRQSMHPNLLLFRANSK